MQTAYPAPKSRQQIFGHPAISLNERASGPDLSLVREAKHGLCVVSGLGKVHGLRAALQGKLMTELIVDEPTADALLRG